MSWGFFELERRSRRFWKTAAKAVPFCAFWGLLDVMVRLPRSRSLILHILALASSIGDNECDTSPIATGKKLTFDAATESFHDPAADALLSREYSSRFEMPSQV